MESLIDRIPPLPRPQTFQSGDFIWPKTPGVYVPYSQGSNLDQKQEENIWMAEKRQFLDRASRGNNYFTADRLQVFRDMSYLEFVALYQGDHEPEAIHDYSSGSGLYVGHVGIIDVSATGEINVIEALCEQGVVRHRYENWLAGRAGQLVWHGRLREISMIDRAQVSFEAAKYVGRPYDFWNFDLDDDSKFYCSKLAWLAIFRRLNFAVDGNPNAKRDFWFSPKQFMHLPAINLLHIPGEYGGSVGPGKRGR